MKTDEKLLTPTSENTELVKQEDVKNTPFQVVSIEGNKHFLALGRFKLSPEMETKEQVLKFLKLNQWDIILTVIVILNEQLKNKTNE